jgi:hypothetical protein
MVVAVALDHQAELLGDPLGRSVAGVDDGNEPVSLEDVAGVVTAGRRRFGGQATALERGAHVLADLDLDGSVDLLRGQAAVADELAGVPQRE